MDANFTPYNQQWKDAMKKLPKETIIDMFANVGQNRVELLESLIEVVRISDRDHIAWDKAKQAIKNSTM